MYSLSFVHSTTWWGIAAQNAAIERGGSATKRPPMKYRVVPEKM
jgi:hypothetical protein